MERHMYGRFSARVRFVSVAAVAVFALGIAAPAALAKPDTPTGPADLAAASSSPSGLAVSSLSSPPVGAAAGESFALHGTVVNSGGSDLAGTVTLRLLKPGQSPRPVGTAGVQVAAGSTSPYETTVALPSGLPDGFYTLAACTPSGGEGLLSCATARRAVKIGDQAGAAPAAADSRAASALAEHVEVCSSGAHTLSEAGDRVYPEMGNGGYTSVHTGVNLIYNAVENKFLPGTNVVLGDRATQCLSDFSLDFERKGPESEEGPGPEMQVEAVTVNGAPATFEFVQPTYPGDPNGQNDPNPLAHEAGLETPVSTENPLPPACTPNSEEKVTTGEGEASIGEQCPANKLVITPAAPIASGEAFEVEVKYSGRPGVHTDGDGSVEGWFLSDEPAGDGSFVTTEPVGTEAWMPLNNHPSAKPTYDFNETVTKGRTAIANGELIGFTANPPEANFPEGSTTWRWHSPQPIASYLVESSIGAYDLSERLGGRGVLYYEAQASSLTGTQKTTNKAVMDTQEKIVEFQERFDGPFPFSSDGVIVGAPSASFEEEMETKITFNGGRISESTFNHENMHQWFGDNVSESNYNMTFFKEGLAQLSEYLLTAKKAAEAKGGLETTEGEAAFEASLVSRFASNYNTTKPKATWTGVPSDPTAATLFRTETTYTRPATAYIALRTILGPSNFAGALHQITREFGGSSIKEPQLEHVFEGWLPNQSATCQARLGTFFTEWFDTAFAATGEPATLKPQLTGPGLVASASGTTFYDTSGSCMQAAPKTKATLTGSQVGGVYTDPTVTLTATPAVGGAAVTGTTYSIDGGAPTAYTVPFTLTGTGEHTVTYFSTDANGAIERQETSEIEVNDPPVTTAHLLPAAVGGQVVGPATVVLTATDDSSGIASTEYALDGGSFQPYTGPITVAALGEHTVEYLSTDRDGAVETAKQLSFTVVDEPPVTTAQLLPAPVGGQVVGPATVVLTATDASSGVASTEYALDGGSFQPYTGPITVAALGKHTVNYLSTSRHGAVETAKQLSFTVVEPEKVEPVIEKVETVVEKVVPGPEKPAPPSQPAPSACAQPGLEVQVLNPLRRQGGVAILRSGRAYRYVGHLTCGGQPAPVGTVVGISSVAKGKSSSRPGVAVGPGGKIDTLLRYAGTRTVVFTFADAAGSAQATVRISGARP
jgi:Peptidase family M1 domain